MDARSKAGLPRSLAHLRRKPGFLTRKDKMMIQFGMVRQKPGKGADQSNLILPRLQIPHGKDKRGLEPEAVLHCPARSLMTNHAKFGARGVRNHRNFRRWNIVSVQDRVAREFADGEDSGGPLDGP